MASGHCREQDDRVFERPQPVHGVGHDEQVVLPGLPGLTCGGQFYLSGQDQDGGLKQKRGAMRALRARKTTAGPA